MSIDPGPHAQVYNLPVIDLSKPHHVNVDQRVAFLNAIVPAPVGLFEDDTWSSEERKEKKSHTTEHQRLVVIGATPDRIERFILFDHEDT
jgi:hypothetical protein